RADSFLIQEMRRYSQASSFDEQPTPELNSEAIDFRVASEFFKPIRKLRRHDLQTLKIVTNYQGRVVPTIGGILLFGVDRLNHYPDAWIQAGRFAGSDRRRIVDSVEVRSYLPRAAEEVIAFLQKHTAREAVIGSVKRTDVWTFPVVAVREAIMNAIVHADYAQHGAPIRVALFDDRLEIENPGPLPLGVSKLSLGWMKMGIVHERIQPGRLQQNGRHERMHRTLKEETTRPVALTLRLQQRKFDRFRQMFNHERPHEGPNNMTPGSVYQPSSVVLPRTLSEFAYPKGFVIRRVNNSGDISWHKGRVFISEVLRFEVLGLELADEDFYTVFFRDIEIGEFDAEALRFRPVQVTR
ncbi:MAG: integrase core domain-containing protein, partial [Silvibacterium sp.]